MKSTNNIIFNNDSFIAKKITKYYANKSNKKLKIVLIGATASLLTASSLFINNFKSNKDYETVNDPVKPNADRSKISNQFEESNLPRDEQDDLIKKLEHQKPSYIYSTNIENLISLPRYQSALISIKHANLYPNKQNKQRVLDELEKLSDYHNHNSIRININENKYATKLDDLIKLKINKNYKHVNPFLNKGLALYISQQLNDDLMFELAFKKPHVDNRFFRTEPPTTILKLNKILGREEYSKSNIARNIYEDTDYALLFEFYDNFVKLFLKNQEKDEKISIKKNKKSKFYSNKELINLINKLNNEINALILSEYSVKDKAKIDVWSDTYLDDYLSEDDDSSKKIKDFRHKQKQDFIDRNEQLILNIVELMTKIDLTEFVNLGGIEFLLFLYEKHKYDDIYLYVIGNCLTCLSLTKEYQKLFIQSGWLKRLNKMLNKKRFKNDSSTIHIPDNINLIRELIAHKILFNLITNHDNLLYSTQVYPLHPNYSGLLTQNDSLIQSNNDHNHMIDVIFIHGLRGSLFRTWRQDDHVVDGSHEDQSANTTENVTKKINLDSINNNIFDKNFFDNLNNFVEINVNNEEKIPSICWPRDWLSEDITNPDDARIIGIDYQSSYSLWGQEMIDDKKLKSNIKQRALDLMEQLKLAHVGTKPIVWICHSMGGLIVKQMLVEYAEMNKKMNILNEQNNILNNTKAIVFLSTPHFGSSIAKTATKFSFALNPSPEVLELAADSSYLVDLNKKFINLITSSSHLMNNMKILSFCENMPTYIGYFNIYAKTVSEKSANLGIGEFKLVDFKDHLNICKPENKNCSIYKEILNIINGIIKHENLSCQKCKADLEFSNYILLTECLYEFFSNAHNYNF